MNYQSWINNEWINGYQTNFKYDSNNNIIWQLNQKWKSGEWVNSNQYVSVFDANNNLTNKIIQNWNGNVWLVYSDFHSSFDKNGFRKMNTTKYWDTDRFISSGDSIVSYFHTANIDNYVNNLPEVGVVLFPNPNNGVFTINSKDPINSIEIFNLQGVKVYSRRKFNHQTTIGIGLLGQFKGTFIMKINCGDKIQTKKIMIY
jgi:hypothetical protein